jgi:myo-inositol 2-dehydrogenase / D-chiro-inositol 1-dehydrogenase
MSGARRLHAAIVGFGGMGQRHYRAYGRTSCDIVAICDWQPDRVRSAVPDFPADRIYADYRSLFAAHADLDVVSVVSNGPTHAEIAIAAMEHGVRRVMLEKPVATNLEAARAVADCASLHAARLSVNHLRRWSVDYARLKALIAGGAIGRLRHIYFSGGSTGLGNFVSHAFDQMRYFFEAEATEVVGWIDRRGTPNPRGSGFLDPGGYGVVGFADGQRGFVDASEDTGVQYMFNFVGEYGRVIVDELNNTWTIRARTPETRDLPFVRYTAATDVLPFEPSEPYDIVTLTGRALAELTGDGPIRCTAGDGIRALELVIAFHESDAAGHGPVALPLVGAALGRDVPIG